ncbi:hypothetical protein J2W17_002214 [Pseudomonas lini]|nr:hypothetical protein [Pseudomonas lini]
MPRCIVVGLLVPAISYYGLMKLGKRAQGVGELS